MVMNEQRRFSRKASTLTSTEQRSPSTAAPSPPHQAPLTQTNVEALEQEQALAPSPEGDDAPRFMKVRAESTSVCRYA
jgi:hypothetical protein